MNLRSRFCLVSVVSLLGFGGLVTPVSLLAQDENESLEIIIVQAPIEIDRKTDRVSSPSAAVETEIVELTRKVSFEDLDLSRTADVQQLEERIRVVAKDSCARLAKMFPFDDSDAQSIKRCTKYAIAGAMEQTEDFIAGLSE